jgi:hypothetical protein
MGSGIQILLSFSKLTSFGVILDVLTHKELTMAKSKKQLFKDLEILVGTVLTANFKDVSKFGLNHPEIGNETYGKESYIYINIPVGVDFSALEQKLQNMGHKIEPNYSRYNKGKTVAVQVTFFKGYGWNK